MMRRTFQIGSALCCRKRQYAGGQQIYCHLQENRLNKFIGTRPLSSTDGFSDDADPSSRPESARVLPQPTSRDNGSVVPLSKVMPPSKEGNHVSTAIPTPPLRPQWKFAEDWNSTLHQHPQTVLATFLSAQSTTWLGLYGSISALGLNLPPELAAGWMVARLTKNFRQPFNVGLAATAVGLVPALSEMKVTPLVTGFVLGEEDRKVLAEKREKFEQEVPAAKKVVNAVSKGASWLAGPVDKYGLSLYLSARLSAVTTIGVSAYLVGQGVDVDAVLSQWGLGEVLGETAGAFAASSVCNVLFVPLHFYTAVYGVRSLEEVLGKASKTFVDAKAEFDKNIREKDKRGENYERSKHEDDQSDHRQHYNEDVENCKKNAIRTATMLLLVYSLGMSLYTLRLMGKKLTSAKQNKDGGEEKQNEEANKSIV